MSTSAEPAPQPGISVASVVRYSLAFASIGAGIIHLTAAADHSEHALVFAFFVGAGIAQILWGTALFAPNPAPRLLRAGALGNAGIIAVWLTSRIAGLAFVPGAEHREPVGAKDVASGVLELLVIAGAFFLISGRASSIRLRLSERHLAPLGAAMALIVAGGIVAPTHHHDADDHDGHEHSELVAAHSHGVEDTGVHDHDVAVEHTHALGSHADHASTHGAHTAEHSHATAHHQEAAAPRTASAAQPPEVTGIEAKVRYGPFVLPPASSGGEAHVNRILQNVAKPCSNCYVVQMTPDLVYADGKSANLDTGVMLHHAVWTRPSFTDTTCNRNSAIGSQGLRFFASGNERTSFHVPSGFGYFVGTDSWALIAELMNHSDQPRTVYVELDVLYRPGSENLKRVTPVWMDIDNCGDSQYSVPAGKSSKLWTWTSTITGRVVATGGHVHNGGVKTVLSNETTHQHMCTSVAGYGTKPEFDGSIESMSTCTWDRLGTVREGEDLGITAYYDSSEAQYDVMGIMLAMVYETDDLAGGSPPPEGSTTPEEQSPPPPGGHDHP